MFKYSDDYRLFSFKKNIYEAMKTQQKKKIERLFLDTVNIFFFFFEF